MRKVTKPSIVCDKCGSNLKSEQYDSFCDNCKTKIIADDIPRVNIFWKDGKSEDFEFCSLKCTKEWLLNFPFNKEEVRFITLPYIHKVDDLKEMLR